MKGLPSSRAITRRLEALAQIAGLAATAWVVWSTVVLGGHLAARIVTAWWIASCAIGWSALIVVVLRIMVGKLNGIDWLPPTFRSAAAGVWFAPALLLMLTFSPVSVPSALVLIFGATLLLLDPLAIGGLNTGELAPPRAFGPALAVSLCLQLAVMAFMMNRLVPAAALFTLGIAMFTALAMATGAWVSRRARNLPRSIMGLCLTVLLALMLGRVLGPGYGGDGSGVASAAPSGISGSPASAPRPLPSRANADLSEARPIPGHEYHVPGSFPGVILWPELQPVPTLVAPLPIANGPAAALARPFVIPFGGEYWMFRRPFDHPPSTSFFQRGTPAWLSFGTPDGLPLQMEARQKLESPIDLACCASIALDVLNADRNAPRISLELLLIDRRFPLAAPISLGSAKLTSIPSKNGDRTVPVAETLTYSVTPDRRSARFDEFQVIFHRAMGLQSHSARIALQRFVLAP